MPLTPLETSLIADSQALRDTGVCNDLLGIERVKLLAHIAFLPLHCLGFAREASATARIEPHILRREAALWTKGGASLENNRTQGQACLI